MAHNEAAYADRLLDIAGGHEHWIRLFELDPGPSCPTTSTTNGFSVSGRLLTCKLTDCPPYLALSYSWGLQPTLVPFVVGSHQDFLISFDLHYALRNLRDGHQRRYVWIDTICINQKDVPERNSQVKIMREVYAHAKCVCIWLGMPPSSAGDLTGARIKDIGYDVVQHIASKADRNWWRRRWVVQEAASAKDEPVILIGSLWLPWKAFIRHCISFNMRIGPSITDRETVREISTFSTIMSTRTSFRRSLDTFNLSFLLRSTVDLHASEPHDAIYAVLGLADEEAKQVVRVDYDMSFIQLYAELTQLLVEASSWGSEFPLDVVISSCWQRLFLAGPSWILDFSHRSTHSANWAQFDNQTMLETTAAVRANLSSQAATTVCGGHVVVKSANENELRASFDQDLRTMTCSGFLLGVIRNIIPVHGHLLSLKIESRPATVDKRAIRIKLQCSASKLASAFRRFENLHSRSLCSVDQMAVFVTTDGAIGMCYSTMNDGRPGLDARSPVLKAGDRVVCLYGAGSPVLVRPLAGESDGERFRLLLSCMFMRDCECYVGQQHSAEAFQRMSFV
jgi:hypothetical protein